MLLGCAPGGKVPVEVAGNEPDTTVTGQDIARPKILPAATVVVLQELFGVNADIRKTCDELARPLDSLSPPDLGRELVQIANRVQHAVSARRSV